MNTYPYISIIVFMMGWIFTLFQFQFHRSEILHMFPTKPIKFNFSKFHYKNSLEISLKEKHLNKFKTTQLLLKIKVKKYQVEFLRN
jgi:hypothetical protein